MQNNTSYSIIEQVRLLYQLLQVCLRSRMFKEIQPFRASNDNTLWFDAIGRYDHPR
jgi:hypothetical protein